MAGLTEWAENWHRLASDAEFFNDCIQATGPELVKVNQEQLKSGMGSDGAPLQDLNPAFRRNGIKQPYRSFKLSMNPRADGRYDMDLTGGSFDTMTLDFQSGQFSIVGAGWANKYQSGDFWWAQSVKGRIWGIYQSDYQLHYKTTYLYPLITRRMRQYLNL